MIYRKVSLDSLGNVAREHPLVCFGAGAELKRFIEYSDKSFPLLAVVDNSKVKQGGSIAWKGENTPICGLSDVCRREDVRDWLITVNPNNLLDVIKQLSDLPGSEEFRIYWSYVVSPQNRSLVNHIMPDSLHLSNEIRIPKIIHYAWFGNNPIPEEHQRYIDGWKKKCPDYKIICWNEKNYDVKKNKYMYQAYEAKKWGFVPDYLRKDVVYQYGGIYLDTDVEIIRPLDDLLYQDGFCGFEGMGVAFGLGFGAIKGLPVLREMRDAYDKLTFEFKPRDEMLIGPDYETRQLIEKGLELTGEYQLVAGMTVYPTEVLSGTVPFTGESIITPVTYTVHHYAGSWDESVNRKKRNISEQLCKKMLITDFFEIEDEMLTW